MDQQEPCKKPYDKLLNNLERSVFTEKSQPRPCRIDLGQYRKVSVWHFPVKTSLLVNK